MSDSKQYSGTGQGMVVTNQPATYKGPIHRYFREAPVQVKCQHCQADAVTTLHYEAGKTAWIACLCIFLWGIIAVSPFLWPGCCIPFCIKAFKDVIHKCPNCEQEVGRYGRFY